MKKVLIIPTIFISLSLVGCFNNKEETIYLETLLNAVGGTVYKSDFCSPYTGQSINDYEYVICDALRECQIEDDNAKNTKEESDYTGFYFYQGPSGPAVKFSWFNIYITNDGYLKTICGRDAKLVSYSQTHYYKLKDGEVEKLFKKAEERYEEITSAYRSAKEQALIDSEPSKFFTYLEDKERHVDAFNVGAPFSFIDTNGEILNDVKELGYTKINREPPNPAPIMKYYYDENWMLVIFNNNKEAYIYYKFTWKFDKDSIITYYSINEEKMEALLDKISDIASSTSN